MAEENFQIYTVQFTGKYIRESSPSLHDLIVRTHVKQSPIKVCSPWKVFLREKNSFMIFLEGDTILYLHIFTISKSFIPNFCGTNYDLSK